MGYAFCALGRYKEAVTCFDRVLAINPRNANTWFNKGVALATLGRREEAIACCDRVLEINPKNAKAWFKKGVSRTYLIYL